MNKPLTIEELKSLEVGDWVWVVDLITQQGQYVQVSVYRHLGKILAVYKVLEGKFYKVMMDILTYGTEWLAYKNKEQAECKGEIVELQPPTIKDTFQGAVIEWEIVTKNHIICDTYSEAERRLAELRR